jgi:uncharacterized protein YgbK (DUF1537 family)
MRLRLGIIADDYTGASDVASALQRNGLKSLQAIGVPKAVHVLPPCEALVIALKIRSIAAHDAVNEALVAARFLKQAGATHILYKICSTFDSTDAGNIGPIGEALRAELDAGHIVVTPAFPETGRTLYAGHLFVGDRLLSESPLKDHPLNPMRDSDLVRVLQRQTKLGVGLAAWPCVRAGEGALRARLVELELSGAPFAIADALTEDDLETIGAVAAQEQMSIGASGLAIGLARAMRKSAQSAPVTQDLEAIGGPAMCLAGSCAQATLRQIAEAAKSMPIFQLDIDALCSAQASEEIARAVAWALERAPQGPGVIASSEASEKITQRQARAQQSGVSAAIEAAMSAIALRLAEGGVRRLIIAGGETSGAIVHALGVEMFEIGPEIAAGVPALRGLGWRAPLGMALKSGNFGAPTFFADAVAAVR